MAIQKTLSIIKPDAFNQKEAISERFAQAGLKSIQAIVHRLTQKEAELFYKDHAEKPFFRSLIELMVSGPIYIQVLEGEEAITAYRALMGPTDPNKAPKGTLRYEFGGKLSPANAVHGSDSPKSAAREIDFFFKD